MVYDRRLFAGAAAQTTISGNITATSLTITIAAATGWPSGAEEFYAVIDPGQATEEKILCTRSSTTLTCASTAKRGVDGTAAASHSNGATIYPCVTAADLDEANDLVSTLTSQGDLLTMDSGPDFKRLAVGASGTVLVSDGSDPSWAQVDTANLADGAVETAKINDDAVTAAKLNDDVYSKELTLNAQTGSYTLVLADAGKIVTMNVASANTVTVPPNASVAFPVGTNVTVIQTGAGQTTLTAGSGVTVNAFASDLLLSGQYAAATLVKTATDVWVAFGNLS